MIKPLRRGEDLAREIKAAKAAGGPDAFDVWWLGQSGFLIQWNKTCLLFDPYLSDSLTKKYAQTNRPHVRMSELAVQPHLLNMIDIVTSSHNHTDHLDADTLQPLLQVNPGIQFVIPEANRTFVCDRLGCAPRRADVGGHADSVASARVGGCHATFGVHDCGVSR